MADNRPDVYRVADGTLVFRASSFGACKKRLIAAGMEMEPAPPPQKMLEKFEEGIRNEDKILSSGTGQGHDVMWADVELGNDRTVGFSWTLRNPNVATDYQGVGKGIRRGPDDGQFTMKLDVTDDITIFGHLDGIAHVHSSSDKLWTPGEVFVIEAKAFGDAYWEKFHREGIDGFPQYQWQMSLYMSAAELPGLFLVGHKDENGDVFEYAAQWLCDPEFNMGVVKLRALMLARKIEAGDLPESCEETWPCPFFYLHEEAPERETYVDAQLEAWLSNMETWRATYTAADNAIKDLKVKIRDRFVELAGEKGTGTVGDYTVTHVVADHPERTVTYKARTDSYVKITKRKADDD